MKEPPGKLLREVLNLMDIPAGSNSMQHYVCFDNFCDQIHNACSGNFPFAASFPYSNDYPFQLTLAGTGLRLGVCAPIVSFPATGAAGRAAVRHDRAGTGVGY